MGNTLHDLPASDRPRTRLQRQGPEALTTAELLSLVLGTGVKGRSSLDAATALLQSTGGSLRAMARRPGAALRVSPGIGAARIAAIQAVCELSRRYASERRPQQSPVTRALDIYEVYAPRLEDLPVEEFHVAILDSQHRIEQDVLVSRGTLNASLAHPREVFRTAIAANACAVFLVHNHPSGDPVPSPADYTLTRELYAAGKLLGIDVLDHVIIGQGRFTSFVEEGFLS
jgi:DNA repair protein RadC